MLVIFGEVAYSYLTGGYPLICAFFSSPVQICNYWAEIIRK